MAPNTLTHTFSVGNYIRIRCSAEYFIPVPVVSICAFAVSFDIYISPVELVFFVSEFLCS